MCGGGLIGVEVWNHVLVYTKALFEDIKSVREVSTGKSPATMIWDSFLSSDLLKEYTRLHFTQHPQVLSILALTSMQREGRSVTEAVATLASETKTVKSLGDKVKALEAEIK